MLKDNKELNQLQIQIAQCEKTLLDTHAKKKHMVQLKENAIKELKELEDHLLKEIKLHKGTLEEVNLISLMSAHTSLGAESLEIMDIQEQEFNIIIQKMQLMLKQMKKKQASITRS